MTITLSGPYRPRPIRSLGVVTYGDWRLKRYGIAADGEEPSPELLAAAEDVALPDLPEPAVTDDRYGVGFLIVHQGADRSYALLDWWTGENMLEQRVYTAPPDDPTALSHAPDAPTACVWELRVLAFERRAWLGTVLDSPTGPDLDAYLGKHLDVDV